MKRASLYSSSGSSGGKRTQSRAPDPSPAAPKPAAEPKARAIPSRAAAWFRRHEKPAYLVIAAVVLFAAIAAQSTLMQPAPAVTQKDVEAAVQKALENRPSSASAAYEAVRRSVVMVRGMGIDEYEGEVQKSVGTGVVLVDTGIILTNLHVAIAAEKLRVVFAGGYESEAEVMSVRPEQDLAVLKAKSLPDEGVEPATLGSANDLQQGDEVIAVGFPFGLGPSVSSGVVSGLKREHGAENGRVLSNLIQFDAAANPGNSGGPLVTAKGEVVGIVTGILNPTPQRVFIGIGFAVPIEVAAAAAGQSPF
jgi:S1-C subfamily serine protease